MHTEETGPDQARPDCNIGKNFADCNGLKKIGNTYQPDFQSDHVSSVSIKL